MLRAGEARKRGGLETRRTPRRKVTGVEQAECIVRDELILGAHSISISLCLRHERQRVAALILDPRDDAHRAACAAAGSTNVVSRRGERGAPALSLHINDFREAFDPRRDELRRECTLERGKERVPRPLFSVQIVVALRNEHTALVLHRDARDLSRGVRGSRDEGPALRRRVLFLREPRLRRRARGPPQRVASAEANPVEVNTPR